MIVHELEKQLAALTSARHFFIGYSGGVDSHVLLHALCALRAQGLPCEINAIHINHSLHSQADNWAQHCQSICDQLQVPLRVVKIQVALRSGDSLEAKAREQRYQQFAQLIEPNCALLTAHNQNDQAETVLLQLMRGAGPKGLSAMPAIQPFKTAVHVRPLLSVSRDDIERYARAEKLRWIEDDSNTDRRFDRNFLRQDIMPLLQARWPAVCHTVSRASQHFSETMTLLTDLAELDLQSLVITTVDNTKCVIKEKKSTVYKTQLSIEKLRLLSPARQKNAIRFWLASHAVPMPSVVKMQHILQDVLLAAPDRNPVVAWGNSELRRFQNRLYLLSQLLPFDNTICLPWDPNQTLHLPGDLGTLPAGSLCQLNLSTDQLAKLDKKKLSIRFRQGGERLTLPGRAGSHKLKTVLQEWGIPPWQRDRIPLLFADDQLISVLR